MKTFRVPRRTASMLVAGALAAGGAFVLSTGNTAQADPAAKVWVCKYVSKPGEAERLSHVIHVSWNAIEGSEGQEPRVGASFSDAQGRSYVVSLAGKDANITIADCPPVTPPPTTTAPPTTEPTTTAPPTTEPTTTAPPTTEPTTTAPPTTEPTTTAPPTTEPTTTAPPTTEPEPTTTVPAPPVTSEPAPPATTPAHTSVPVAPGPGTTPGAGAPSTGGAGEGNPVNGLIGSGLLLAAAGVLGGETLRRRRETTQD